MKHASRRRIYRKADSVRDRMRSPYSFYIKCAYSYPISCFYRMKLCRESVLLKLIFYETKCESRAVYRHIYLFEQIWYTADMILVSMRKYEPLYLTAVFHQVSKIGNYAVNTKHIIIRERHTAVYNQYLIVILEKRHIFANFIESANRYNFKRQYFCFYRIFLNFRAFASALCLYCFSRRRSSLCLRLYCFRLRRLCRRCFCSSRAGRLRRLLVIFFFGGCFSF